MTLFDTRAGARSLASHSSFHDFGSPDVIGASQSQSHSQSQSQSQSELPFVQDLPDDVHARNAVLQSQATEEDVRIESYQPSPDELAQHGIKVNDFAYTNPLRVRTIARPLWERFKRGRANDVEPGSAAALLMQMHGLGDEISPPKKQKLGHNLVRAQGFEDLTECDESVPKDGPSLMGGMRARPTLVLSTPPRLQSQPPLEASTDASQDSENLVPTPVVTPHGSMYLPLSMFGRNVNSQMYTDRVPDELSYSQVGLEIPSYLQSQSQEQSQSQSQYEDPFAPAPEPTSSSQQASTSAAKLNNPVYAPSFESMFGPQPSFKSRTRDERPRSPTRDRKARRPSPYHVDTPTKRSRSAQAGTLPMRLRSPDDASPSPSSSPEQDPGPQRGPPAAGVTPSGSGPSELLQSSSSPLGPPTSP